MLEGLSKNERPFSDRKERSKDILTPKQIQELQILAHRFSERLKDPRRQISTREQMKNIEILPAANEEESGFAVDTVGHQYAKAGYGSGTHSPSYYDGDNGRRYVIKDQNKEIVGTFAIVVDTENVPDSIPAGAPESFDSTHIPDRIKELQSHGLRLMEVGQFASVNKDMFSPEHLKTLDTVLLFAAERGIDAIVVQINPRHYMAYMASGFYLLAQGRNLKVNAPAGLFCFPVSKNAEDVVKEIGGLGIEEQTKWPMAA